MVLSSVVLGDLIEAYVRARIELDRAPDTDARLTALTAMEAVRDELEAALGIGSELAGAYLRRQRPDLYNQVSEQA